MNSCRSKKPRLYIKPVDGAWYNIPQYNGRYQVNNKGEIQRTFSDGKTKIMKARYYLNKQKSNLPLLKVRLTKEGGERRDKSVGGIMLRTFYRLDPNEWRVEYKDGNRMNNSIDNIEVMSIKGYAQNHTKHRREVIRISERGEIIGHYSGMTEASEKCYYAKASIDHRCKHLVKKEFQMDGTTFRYADDESVDEFCTMLKAKVSV